MSDPFASAPSATRYFTEWMRSEALPFWMSDGYDAVRGRFHERLDFAGRPLRAVPHRVMAQARQVFVYAHAARLGWAPDGGAVAQTAMDDALSRYRLGPDEGFAFSVGPHGDILDPRRDAYAHAFLLLALAALHRLDRDARWLVEADAILAFLDRELADAEHGGLFEASPGDVSRKLQNPHMHLFEALLALEAAAPGRGYRERARGLAELFVARMYRAEGEWLPEVFARDWSDATQTGGFEPGHHFEWVWLLHAWGDALAGFARGLLRSALRTFAPDGVVIDEAAPDGRILRASRRLWPQTEALKAAAATRDSALAVQAVNALSAHFLDRPFAGVWVDHFDAGLRPLVDFIPCTSLYHLTLAASEAERAFGPSAGGGDHRAEGG